MALDVIIGVAVWLLGLCVGSFVNVVVYRLPAGLSITNPPRSFCPKCKRTIAWYDNIPLLSWLLLRARCRSCAAPISLQYPLVEAATGLTFVLIYYLLFAADARVGVGPASHPADWPLLLSWLALAAALIACAAMDVTSYLLDVRVTYAAVVAGILAHTLWPRPDFFQPRAATPLAAGAVAAFLVSGVVLWLTVWLAPADENDVPEAEEGAPTASAPVSDATSTASAATAGRLAIAVFVGLTLWLAAETGLAQHHARDVARLRLPGEVEVYDATPSRASHGLAPHVAVPAALLVLFSLTVLVGGQPRLADSEVTAAIEDEQPQARRMAGRELLWLTPSILAGVAAGLAVACIPSVTAAWSAAIGWTAGGFCPAGGFAFAALGAVAGAGAGWVLRILFTLVFGKEALGVGDIYILAAAGAAAGWDIVLLGLLLAVGIALAGYILGLVLKRSAIIPFGPWLAIGFVAALWLNRPAAYLAGEYYEAFRFTWSRRPDICVMAGGVLLIGFPLAVLLARLVRRLVEPPARNPSQRGK